MKKFYWLIFCAAALALLGASAASAQESKDTCDLVYLFDAASPATIPGAPNGVVYGELVNLGDAADIFLGARSDVAETVELYNTTVDESGVMQMMPVEGGLEIPANSFVELKTGGLHLMLVNLKAPLQTGDSFSLTLNFRDAGEVSVTVPVQAMVAEMSMDMGMATPEMGMAATEMASMPVPSMDWGACAQMHVVGAWARPSLPGAPNTGAYALLVNLTDRDDTLVSAATSITQATELHEMTMGANDVMEMRPIEGGIPVPAGGTAQLKPGGMHVMLIGLKEELPAGSAVEITYTFANGGVVTLSVPVHPPVEGGMAMGG